MLLSLLSLEGEPCAEGMSIMNVFLASTGGRAFLYFSITLGIDEDECFLSYSQGKETHNSLGKALHGTRNVAQLVKMLV